MNAKLFQDILNGHGLSFRITDERVKQTTYEKTHDVVGVLETMGGGYLYDQTGNRVLSFQIEFKGANKDFEQFRTIVETHFPNDELVGDFWVYSQPLEFTDFMNEEGHRKFNARIVFQVVEVVGGVSGKSSYIKVDDVEIDFARVLYRQDKTLMPFQSFGNNHNVKLVSEVISLKLPVSENAKNKQLLLAGLNDTYNQSYLIEWQVGGIVKTFEAVLRVGIIEYDNTHKPIMFDITFERALPREEWGVALFRQENFWEVDKTAKAFDETYDVVYETESDFREFLDTLDKLDNEGYVVRSGQIEQREWQEMVGSPTEQNDLYIADDSDLYENQDKSVEALVAYIETFFDYIDQEEFILALYYPKRNKWVFVEEIADSVSGYILDEVEMDWDEEGFMDYLNEEYPPAEWLEGIYYITNDYTMSNWVAQLVVVNEYRFFQLKTVESDMFYGEVKEGGQYGSPFATPVVDFSIKQTTQTTTKPNDEMRVVGSPLYYGTAMTVLFLVDNTTQQFIDDLYERKGNLYEITFEIGAKTYTYKDMIITDIERQNTENANQIMQITFEEGEL